MGNREKLLAAASQCLFEKGYGQTTVRDITSIANVSMAAIGYHFGSKEALMTTALLDALDSGAAFDDGAESAQPVPPRQLWAQLLESFSSNRTFWIANLEAVLQAQRDPKLREQLAAGHAEGRSGMSKVLLGGAESDLTEEATRSLGSVQLALIGGIMMQYLSDPEAAPDVDEVLDGIEMLAQLSKKDLSEPLRR